MERSAESGKISSSDYAAAAADGIFLSHPRFRQQRPNGAKLEEEAMHLVTAENSLQLVAAIVLAGIILFELRTAVIALNNAERYYTAFTLVLASAVVCLAVLSR